jgi:tetratricopeptide (TPR) repeat protein
LVNLEGTNTIPFLDQLFARDRFEERPLIWKALLLHRQGDKTEAEKLIRQAIAIDPSDGEQGPGNRMRAYAVLAEIRGVAGDEKEKQFFQNVGRAIRLSENADKLHDAGLITHALEGYKDALNFFADAYCVQSRLALRMSELGQHQAAEAHYQKAYELMPDSFGRVESHCFGCEAIFGNARAQTVAEKVFSRLVAASPNKPQLHYLLGYLRKEQRKYDEAKKHLLDAVRLDPDYLNAWKELQALSDEASISRSDRDRITFNILRLDPLMRHAHVDVSNVSDLAALWRAAEQALRLQLKAEREIYALRATKERLERVEKTLAEAGQSADRFGSYYRPDEGFTTPGELLAQTSLLRAAATLIDSALTVTR